jgi:hypothetical protein
MAGTPSRPAPPLYLSPSEANSAPKGIAVILLLVISHIFSIYGNISTGRPSSSRLQPCGWRRGPCHVRGDRVRVTAYLRICTPSRLRHPGGLTSVDGRMPLGAYFQFYPLIPPSRGPNSNILLLLTVQHFPHPCHASLHQSARWRRR